MSASPFVRPPPCSGFLPLEGETFQRCLHRNPGRLFRPDPHRFAFPVKLVTLGVDDCVQKVILHPRFVSPRHLLIAEDDTLPRFELPPPLVHALNFRAPPVRESHRQEAQRGNERRHENGAQTDE